MSLSVFNGKKFHTIFSSDNEIENLLNESGAICQPYLSESLSFVISDSLNNTEVGEAEDIYNVAVVTSEWVRFCMKINEIKYKKCFHPFSRKLFDGYYFHVANVSESDLKKLHVYLRIYGGTYCDSLVETVNCLVLGSIEGESHDEMICKVADHKVKIVTPKWVIDCINDKTIHPFESYNPTIIYEKLKQSTKKSTVSSLASIKNNPNIQHTLSSTGYTVVHKSHNTVNKQRANTNNNASELTKATGQLNITGLQASIPLSIQDSLLTRQVPINITSTQTYFMNRSSNNQQDTTPESMNNKASLNTSVSISNSPTITNTTTSSNTKLLNEKILNESEKEAIVKQNVMNILGQAKKPIVSSMNQANITSSSPISSSSLSQIYSTSTLAGSAISNLTNKKPRSPRHTTKAKSNPSTITQTTSLIQNIPPNNIMKSPSSLDSILSSTSSIPQQQLGAQLKSSQSNNGVQYVDRPKALDIQSAADQSPQHQKPLKTPDKSTLQPQTTQTPVNSMVTSPSSSLITQSGTSMGLNVAPHSMQAMKQGPTTPSTTQPASMIMGPSAISTATPQQTAGFILHQQRQHQQHQQQQQQLQRQFQQMQHKNMLTFQQQQLSGIQQQTQQSWGNQQTTTPTTLTSTMISPPTQQALLQQQHQQQIYQLQQPSIAGQQNHNNTCVTSIPMNHPMTPQQQQQQQQMRANFLNNNGQNSTNNTMPTGNAAIINTSMNNQGVTVANNLAGGHNAGMFIGTPQQLIMQQQQQQQIQNNGTNKMLHHPQHHQLQMPANQTGMMSSGAVGRSVLQAQHPGPNQISPGAGLRVQTGPNAPGSYSLIPQHTTPTSVSLGGTPTMVTQPHTLVTSPHGSVATPLGLDTNSPLLHHSPHILNSPHNHQPHYHPANYHPHPLQPHHPQISPQHTRNVSQNNIVPPQVPATNNTLLRLPQYFGHEHVLQNKFAVIPQQYPINRENCLIGCTFYLIGYDHEPIEKRDQWKMAIKSHGGDIIDRYDPHNVTHLIVDYQLHDPHFFKYALRSKTRIVTIYWVNDMIEKGYIEPPSDLIHLPSPFMKDLTFSYIKKQIVSITGFEGEERKRVEHCVIQLGVKYTEYLEMSNTVLICKKPSGKKYDTAQKFGIACVNVRWLQDLYFGDLTTLSATIHHKYQSFEAGDVSFRLDRMSHRVQELMVGWTTSIKLDETVWKKYQILKDQFETEKSSRKRLAESNFQNSNDSKRPRWNLPSLSEDEINMAHTCPIRQLVNNNTDDNNTSDIDELLQSNDLISGSDVVVAFTGLSPEQRDRLTDLVLSLGGSVVEDIPPYNASPNIPSPINPSVLYNQQMMNGSISRIGNTIIPKRCTHLVSGGLVRTVKFYRALLLGLHIVSPKWIQASALRQQFLVESPWQIQSDTSNLVGNSTSISKILTRAKERAENIMPALFHGLEFYLSPRTRHRTFLSELIVCSGGQIRDKRPIQRHALQTPDPTHLLICHEEEAQLALYLTRTKTGNRAVHHEEFVLSSVLLQQLDFESFQLQYVLGNPPPPHNNTSTNPSATMQNNKIVVPAPALSTPPQQTRVPSQPPSSQSLIKQEHLSSLISTANTSITLPSRPITTPTPSTTTINDRSSHWKITPPLMAHAVSTGPLTTTISTTPSSSVHQVVTIATNHNPATIANVIHKPQQQQQLQKSVLHPQIQQNPTMLPHNQHPQILTTESILQKIVTSELFSDKSSPIKPEIQPVSGELDELLASKPTTTIKSSEQEMKQIVPVIPNEFSQNLELLNSSDERVIPTSGKLTNQEQSNQDSVKDDVLPEEESVKDSSLDEISAVTSTIADIMESVESSQQDTSPLTNKASSPENPINTNVEQETLITNLEKEIPEQSLQPPLPIITASSPWKVEEQLENLIGLIDEPIKVSCVMVDQINPMPVETAGINQPIIEGLNPVCNKKESETLKSIDSTTEELLNDEKVALYENDNYVGDDHEMDEPVPITSEESLLTETMDTS